MMRIKEDIVALGNFWLPEFPDNKLPGTVRIRDGGNSELELIGLFNNALSDINSFFNNKNYEQKYKRIIGQVEKLGLITLDNCIYNGLSHNVFTKVVFNVYTVFVNVGYETNDVINFNKFIFSVEGLDDWLGISGIKAIYDESYTTVQITYNPLDEISMSLSNGMTLSIIFSAALPGSPIVKEAKITQKAYFEIYSKNAQPLSTYQALAYRITTFLCFAIDGIVTIDKVVAHNNELSRELANGEFIPEPIDIYFPSLPHSEVFKEKHSIEMLFSYGNIKNNITNYINRWIDAYNVIEPSLNLYFAEMTGGHKYLESQFLTLAQALETYHRRTSPRKLMKDSDYEELKAKLLESCPENGKEWLTGRLIHGNELTLSQRIKDIIGPFKDLLGNNEQRTKLINKIVSTRNYLTHYELPANGNVVDFKEMWRLTTKMEAITQLHFLTVIGFTPLEIRQLIHKGSKLNYKLNL